MLQLLQNAKDALPEGGTLHIHTEAIDGKLMRITVRDSGPGIPAASRERIFERFFTTKASKGHKGMGLAIVHRVVEEHLGKVSVDSHDSDPQRGTAFCLTFPAAREALHLI